MSSPDRATLRLCKARLNPFKITQQALRDQPHQGKCESWCLMKGDNNRVLVDPVDPDPPPLKWSTLSYGFALKEDRNAEEELQAGGDRREAAAG